MIVEIRSPKALINYESDKKDKTFDSVKMMREIRNRLVLKIKK